jgi:hypothetical protein
MKTSRSAIMNDTIKAPDTGSILKTFLGRKGVSKALLAQKLGYNTTCVYVYFKRPTMQVSLLWRLSILLGHNFFKDIAALLPADLSTNVLPDNTKDNLLTIKDEQIAALQKENERLIMERDILKEVLRISK